MLAEKILPEFRNANLPDGAKAGADAIVEALGTRRVSAKQRATANSN
ncbi:hypothetical protein GCM10023264_11860 [Sphingomonas daechungensis]|nr:hypothetical protein [Sphingomonas daechungensis]